MISALLAAASICTFTATATGVEKGAPVEFLFTDKSSDNDYEAMFFIDGSIEDFCRKIETAGIPRGKAESVADCILWPSGCKVTLKPALSEFVATSMPQGMSLGEIIYTGGTRDGKGAPIASTNQPCAAFAFYSLGQSPLVFNGIYPQGDVYGAHTAARALKKGEKVEFTLTWDGKSRPKQVTINLAPGKLQDALKLLKHEAETNDCLDVKVAFSPEMTVRESIAAAQALSVIDSLKVKINGRDDGTLFYRAFMPLAKWYDRSERLVQPFELAVTNDVDTLTFIAEDWSGEGTDPKLTAHPISFAEAKQYPRIHTCFIYASKSVRLRRLYAAMTKLDGMHIDSWYVLTVD